MRCIKWSWVVVVGSLLAWPSAAAQAQQSEREEGDAPRRPALRERVLRAFDEDGDGRLNDQEREAVRSQLGEFREQLRETREQRSETREGDTGRRGPEAERRREGQQARDA